MNLSILFSRKMNRGRKHDATHTIQVLFQSYRRPLWNSSCFHIKSKIKLGIQYNQFPGTLSIAKLRQRRVSASAEKNRLKILSKHRSTRADCDRFVGHSCYNDLGNYSSTSSTLSNGDHVGINLRTRCVRVEKMTRCTI